MGNKDIPKTVTFRWRKQTKRVKLSDILQFLVFVNVTVLDELVLSSSTRWQQLMCLMWNSCHSPSERKTVMKMKNTSAVQSSSVGKTQISNCLFFLFFNLFQVKTRRKRWIPFTTSPQHEWSSWAKLPSNQVSSSCFLSVLRDQSGGSVRPCFLFFLSSLFFLNFKSNPVAPDPPTSAG